MPSRPTAPADRKAPSIDRRLRSELTPVRWALLTSALVGTCLSITVIVQAFALARLLAWAAHPGGRPTPSSTIVVLAMALGARALLGLLGDGLAGQSATAENFAHAANRILTGAKGHGHNDFKIGLAHQAIVRALGQAAAGTPQSQTDKRIQ